MNLLEAVEVSDGVGVVGTLDPGNGVQREVGFSGKVVEGEDVVVEHGEAEHGRALGALVRGRGAEKCSRMVRISL